MQTAFLALGSNLGDRLRHLQNAVRGLSDAGVEIRRVSPVYRTAAHTLDPGEVQPDYFNAVVEAGIRRPPPDLLRLAKTLEQRAGRDLGARIWAPRPLDIDLLTVGGETLQSPTLTLPHPQIAQRRFVLRPWADLAPNLVVPSPFDATVSALLRRCADTEAVERTTHTLGVSPTEHGLYNR
jgi:2-amino-4-hydroxy-6-hydroxymethyldihydropteridine diphosphokinase